MRWRQDGIPVDLMIAEAMAGPSASKRRGARVPPHSPRAMRRAYGLEASIVDNAPRQIESLCPDEDRRSYLVRVAGPGAILVAKLHKIGERGDDGRAQNKDAHDLYRLLVATPTTQMAEVVSRLLADDFSAQVTKEALANLDELFASGPDALGASMAGKAEAGVGQPDVASASVSALARELLEAVGR